MKCSAQQAHFLRNTIDAWKKDNLLEMAQAERLKQSIEEQSFDWQRLAKYTLRIAAFCGIIALLNIFHDTAVVKMIENAFHTPETGKSLVLAIFAGAFYTGALIVRRQRPSSSYTYQTLFFLGIISTANSLSHLGAGLHLTGESWTHFLLFSTALYLLLAIIWQASMIWIFALMTLGVWFNDFTSAGHQAFFLGMNTPLRFVLLGLCLSFVANAFNQAAFLKNFKKTTLIVGLLYTFIALWLVSIVGNQGQFSEWHFAAASITLLWSGLFALAAGGSLVHGIRCKNTTTLAFGFVFLIINAYTRFFEYAWGNLHRAIFFGVLALSLALLGAKAEKVWRGLSAD